MAKPTLEALATGHLGWGDALVNALSTGTLDSQDGNVLAMGGGR